MTDINQAISTMCAAQTSFVVGSPLHGCEYYIYSVHDAAGRVVYVGHDFISAIVNFDQLRRDPSFDVTQAYSVLVVGHCPTLAEARGKVVEYMRSLCGTNTPIFNMTADLNRRRAVKCDQTGAIYQNASAACKALRIPHSNMSQHLAKRKGHKSIKGMTFSYSEFYARDEEGRINLRKKVAS